MKVITVLGARPQFIKASVVSAAFEKARVEEVIVHTGQHFDKNMSDVFFSELGIPAPQHELNIHGGTHGVMTGKMLEGIETVLLAEKPDAVLVYGDTNSTIAGALAAAKLHIPVAHVEAGLRSFNMAMPEEINRILTDKISTWLFTPTSIAEQHLLSEGVTATKIVAVGDVMYDVASHFGSKVDENGRILQKLGLGKQGYVLATVHRAENTDDPARWEAIVAGLEQAAESIPVVWPLHPRIKAVLEKAGRLKTLSANIHVIPPVSYLDMVQLEKYAAVIATDSGGVQKEAFFYQVPCVTLRDETEWVELVEGGWNRLVSPTGGGEIAAAILAAVGSEGAAIQPYGYGNAADLIVNHLLASLVN